MTIPEVTTQAAKQLTQLLEVNQTEEVPTLLLVSGGSALQILNQIPDQVLGEFLTLTVLDERYSLDPTVNNFYQLMETKLYKDAVQSGCHFIETTLKPAETTDQLAARFESDLRQWRSNYPGGQIIITQGMGADGHTAGIMPFPENPTLFESLFNNPKIWVVSYDAGSKNQYPIRVTTTLGFLRQVGHTIFFACGQDKEHAFKKAMNPASSIAETPAKILLEIKNASIFTDIPNKPK